MSQPDVLYPIEGGCLCGAVRYRLSAAPILALHCHCENCRRASGAALLTWITVDAADFQWLCGEPKRYRYDSEHYPGGVERCFCADCGSQLGWHGQPDGTVDLTAGCLDDLNLVQPRFHHFVRRELPWMRVDDGLPRHPGRATGG